MNRRGFLTGIGALIAAPAVVKFASLMPVRGIIHPIPLIQPIPLDYAELVRVTRQAMLPRLVAQVYRENPLVTLIRNGHFNDGET